MLSAHRQRATLPHDWGALHHLAAMAASLSKQVSAMDSLAWKITYEWNQAKSQHKGMAQMQIAWRGIQQSADYQCLADKRKESVFYLWHHTRNRVLAENQLFGRWYNGRFHANWCDLPESIKYDQSMVDQLPSGHFWLDENRNATTVRYFISEDCRGEDVTHFLAPVATADC